MKIVDIRLTGLAGGTVEGGWANDLKPEDDLNTVVEVISDEGLIGVGSAMTGKALVEAAVRLLRPVLIDERADEPARVTEKLRQSYFWQGRGGTVEHAISGLDIALWDLFGKICKQPVARLLGGYYRHKIKPYGSMLPRCATSCSRQWPAASRRSSSAGGRSVAAIASSTSCWSAPPVRPSARTSS